MTDCLAGVDVCQGEPLTLSHIKGQPQVIETLQVHIDAHFRTRYRTGRVDQPLGPTILAGPSGTGKTLVAKALHAELGNLQLTQTNGETLNQPPELFAILLNADENTTVFIDEAQGMKSKTQHVLLTAISERLLPIAGALSRHRYGIPLKPFTLVLATTHEYLLQDALRNRMRVYCRFDYYSVPALIEIVSQRANALGWAYESPDVPLMVAERAKGIARYALERNLTTCRHVALSHDRDVITLADMREAFHHLQVDELGLDDLDRRYLRALLRHGPTSLNVLTATLGLPSRTIQGIVEPYLLKQGFVSKDISSRRILAEAGRKHLETTAWQTK